MVMGINPLEVGKMSLWHYLCAVRGWNKANSPSKAPAPEMTPELEETLGTEMQWHQPT